LGKFLKLDSISLFVFFGEFYQVSLNPVFQPVACDAPLTRPGGRATLSCSPRPTISDRFLLLFLGSSLRLWKWLASSPSVYRTALG
jgi:hypothetical protein